VPRDLADPLLRELGSWLEPEAGVSSWLAEALAVRAGIGAGDTRTGLALRRLITAHGLAPFLVRDPAAAAVVATLPDDIQAWRRPG
jgi:hypothetical protein